MLRLALYDLGLARKDEKHGKRSFGIWRSKSVSRNSPLAKQSPLISATTIQSLLAIYLASSYRDNGDTHTVTVNISQSVRKTNLLIATTMLFFVIFGVFGVIIYTYTGH